MIIKEQIEITNPGSKLGVDYEFIDYSDGNGQQIRRINPSFNMPTKSQLNAASGQANQKKSDRGSARNNVKNGQSGKSLPDAIRRIEELETIISELL